MNDRRLVPLALDPDYKDNTDQFSSLTEPGPTTLHPGTVGSLHYKAKGYSR
ncbi:hypothetical protein LCGC14_1845660 [marine sediment metagenome]|uniref:Uncharacterized protein n=1 Tax=marine sediment metagenome TaxID=412755 RepID=A0A0F9IRH9_9ZZZZ